MPPDRMRAWRGSRPLKRWRYVGVFGADVMLCAAQVRIGGIPQGFWAVWDRTQQRLSERTSFRPRCVRVTDELARADDLELRLQPEGEPVCVTSSHGSAYIWTRKQPVRARGTVRAGGRRIEVDARGLLDDSAGYHARHTAWQWSAGVGAAADGRALAWNLVDGVHDALSESERTLWVDGAPRELRPVRFAEDLSAVAFRDGGELRFAQEAVRERSDSLVVFASEYRQPFGTFSGAFLGGIELAEGFGVMERHDVRW